MRGNRWHVPLDPECPDNPVTVFNADPMTQAYGLDGDEEFTGPMEAKHLKECERCRLYGAENVEPRAGRDFG